MTEASNVVMPAAPGLSEYSDKAGLIAAVCNALASNQTAAATDLLTRHYPFVAFSNVGRRYSIRRACAVFARDGFIDRYSGGRLIFPATLHLISKRLPEQFPFQTNWRMDACHIGYWELCPTIDHLVPVARGGVDSEDNWVTTTMARNAAKANFTLEEIGWSLKPPGAMSEWDGLMGWFLEQAAADPTILADHYFHQWFAAANSIDMRGA